MKLNRIECLDGLRGLAALWVLIGHCMVLTGYYVPILGQPDFGVDLFIVLSGFLMVFQYNLRKNKENWDEPTAWKTFWVRRFFRLSPLYFCLLIVALVAGKAIYADRVLIDTFLHHDLQDPQRYIDASAMNFLIHFTYAFGLLPNYAFRTPLPDWSLGLEMQFYALFPFIVLLARRIGWLPAAIGVGTASLMIAVLLRVLHVSFPMPSFLPLKLHIFLAGMLVAAALDNADNRKILYFLLALAFSVVPIGGSHGMIHLLMRAVILICFFALVHWRHVGMINRLLGSPPMHWLGELSYGVYLLHLLILHRVAAWTIGHWGNNIPAGLRFGIALAIVVPVVYGIAYVTYSFIERPGQTLGRNLLQALGKRREARSTAAEEIAAP